MEFGLLLATEAICRVHLVEPGFSKPCNAWPDLLAGRRECPKIALAESHTSGHQEFQGEIPDNGWPPEMVRNRAARPLLKEPYQSDWEST